MENSKTPPENKANSHYVHPSLKLVENPSPNSLLSQKNVYIATDKIPKGTLIMKSAAWSKILFSDIIKTLTEEEKATLNQDSLPEVTHKLLAQNIGTAVCRNPNEWQERSNGIWPTEEISEDFLSKMDPSAKTHIKKLEEHLSLYLASAKFLEASEEFRKKEIKRIAIMILLNPFNVEIDADRLSAGVGFFPEGLKLDHSCWPNSTFYTIGTKTNPGSFLFIRSIRDIQPNDKITIALCEIYLPRRERQDYLQTQFMFSCNCHRCTDTSFQQRDDALTACVCHSCNSRLVKQDNNKNDDVGEWKCIGCSATKAETGEFGEHLNTLRELANSGLENKMKRNYQVAKEKLDQFEALNTKWNIFHMLHVYRFKALCALISINETLIADSTSLLLTLREKDQMAFQGEHGEQKVREELEKVILLSKDMNLAIKSASICARIVLPPYSPEVASLMWKESTSLKNIARFSVGSRGEEGRDVLMTSANKLETGARDVWKICRGGPEEKLVQELEMQAEEQENKKIEKK